MRQPARDIDTLARIEDAIDDKAARLKRIKAEAHACVKIVDEQITGADESAALQEVATRLSAELEVLTRQKVRVMAGDGAAVELELEGLDPNAPVTYSILKEILEYRAAVFTDELKRLQRHGDQNLKRAMEAMAAEIRKVKSS